jgi:hypothetical protein
MSKFYDGTEDIIEYGNFNQYGDYRNLTAALHNVDFDHIVDDVVDKYENLKCFTIYQTKIQPDFQLLCTFFGWFPADKIK